jgi:4-alpha-glucanotransferase
VLDPVLAELADACGVTTSFTDWRGQTTNVREESLVAILAALGVDAHDHDAAARELARRRDAGWRRMLPPYVVARVGAVGAARVAAHVPHGAPVAVEVVTEDGERRSLTQLMIWVGPREVDGELVGEATFEIPADLPLGYHRLVARSGDAHAACPLVVVPDRIELPQRREWGLMLQLYAVRSSASWALGDLADLRTIATWSGSQLGAGFVLVNPLHAAASVPPMEPSPYFPSSRRFVNPIYLRVEDVPEVAQLRGPDAAHLASAAGELRALDGVDEDIDRDRVWAAKRAVLERAFAARSDAARSAAFERFVADAGEPLADFATWCALADRHGLPWRDWPRELQEPRSDEVAVFAKGEPELVEFHMWLQWLCAEQLDAVQRAATQAGMSIGLIHDLAVGINPTGADAWALRDVLAPGVTLGAPADMYNQQGQRWNLPTWRPDRLAAAEFAPYRELVRAALCHGGGLRIDHVIGLFRQWWVPDGASPADGAYVRLDHEAMVGIVLLEAQRAGAVVIGEDLGTVEPWVRDHLRDRGVLGTSILWFEHDDAGRPRPADQWRQCCLASVTTHDLPPTAGYLTGEHVEIRAELGLLERAAADERAADEADRLAWLRTLADAGLLDHALVEAVATSPPPGTVSPRRDNLAARIEPHLDAIVAALHAYLARTPALMLGVYLPDLVGDRRPVNQPGTLDEYPNWRVPVTDGRGRAVLLDDIVAGSAGRAFADLLQAPQAHPLR